MYRNNRDSSQYRCWHNRDHHRRRRRCTYAHKVRIILRCVAPRQIYENAKRKDSSRVKAQIIRYENAKDKKL